MCFIMCYTSRFTISGPWDSLSQLCSKEKLHIPGRGPVGLMRATRGYTAP